MNEQQLTEVKCGYCGLEILSDEDWYKPGGGDVLYHQGLCHDDDGNCTGWLLYVDEEA